METGNKKGFLARLREGLKKTNANLAGKIVRLATGRMTIDDDMVEEIEEALITADVGMPTTMALTDTLKKAAKRKEITRPDEVRPFLQKEIESMLGAKREGMEWAKPHVILVVGVNGAGKTTTIGKLAHYFTNEKKGVLLAAGDTFRAAATEQLAEWSRRMGCDIVRHAAGADPSAVAFDAIKAGVARGKDVIIVDTAGRLHTRFNLMEELKKVRRIIARELEGAPHETLLVLDGTTGQNAISQVREFNNALPLTGLVLTKLDGTAKGGAVISIVRETGIPVKFLGIGEGMADLQPFDPSLFAEAIMHS